MDSIVNLLCAAVLAGVPLLFGTLGEILTEKSGNLNLGVEGMMYMGAIGGLSTIYFYEMYCGAMANQLLCLVLAVAGSFLCGALGALIFSFLTITLRANQNVTGLTLTIFGTGFGNFFGEIIGSRSASNYMTISTEAKAAFANHNLLPFLANSDSAFLQGLNKMFFGYNWLIYFGIAIALVMAWVLKYTRIGLNLRAVGESPATADAAGINVERYKYLATIIGGGICGIGGGYISLVISNGVWVNSCVNGKGWIAVALVIFAVWSPARALMGSLVFGGLSIMRLYIPLGIPMELYDTLPYVATIVVLIFTSVKQTKEHAQPAHCGLNYFREER